MSEDVSLGSRIGDPLSEEVTRATRQSAIAGPPPTTPLWTTEDNTVVYDRRAIVCLHMHRWRQQLLPHALWVTAASVRRMITSPMHLHCSTLPVLMISRPQACWFDIKRWHPYNQNIGDGYMMATLASMVYHAHHATSQGVYARRIGLVCVITSVRA